MTNQSAHSNSRSGPWATEITLSGNPFKWKLDNSNSLHIWRELQSGNTYRSYLAGQIDQIIDYMQQNNQVDLSNNVQKLRDGTEKEGLGKFIYETFNFSETDTQTAGHLASIFVRTNLWKWNGKSKGMQFGINMTEWQDAIHKYYEQGTK